MQTLELKLPPPIVVAFVAAAMWATARLGPTARMGFYPPLPVAAVSLLVGLAITAAGVAAFRRARTTINPVDPGAASTIVSTGVFAYTRNPMYLGFTFVLVAWATYLRAPWSFLGPLVFVLFINRFQIIPEERILSAKFGSAYDTYRHRTGRWVRLPL